MKYIFFTALVSILLLTACLNTEGLLEFKGKVLDESTKSAISGRKVIIKALEDSDNEFISSYAGYFTTDSAGTFSYTLTKVKKAYWYEFSVVGDTSFACLNKRISLGELNSNGKFLSFYLDKLADFTIKINRMSKIPILDTLYVSWVSNGIDGKTMYPYEIGNNWIYSKEGLRWIGGDIKSVIRTKVYADKRTIVRWELFREGKYKEIIDTIFCVRDAANSVYLKY